jgi:hypothetical protein
MTRNMPVAPGLIPKRARRSAKNLVAKHVDRQWHTPDLTKLKVEEPVRRVSRSLPRRACRTGFLQRTRRRDACRPSHLLRCTGIM